MSALIHQTFPSEDQSSAPLVHISYECVLRERSRESATYLYEVACSITYPAVSGYLSIRVSGYNTYRSAATREIPFTRHEAGATTYVELLEDEQLEVRIIEHGGAYQKALYYAHEQKLIEQNGRGVVSTVQRIASIPEAGQNKKSG